MEGKLANYQCDGWKNIAKTSLISAMIVVDDEAVPVRTHDMTGRPKTGDELFSLVKADFAFVKETYGVEIIAAVTDDGPDGKKMRRLVKEDPDLRMAVFECWAHQAGLLTGNYLGVKQDFMEAASHGNDIIKWFNNHGKALDLLRNQQILILLKEYALLYPASTRWTSQFTCLSRLSSQEAIILGCVAQHRDELLLAAGPKADAKAKATEIIDRCLEPGFWRDLKRIVRHLEPLAIAANIFQDPSCRLDHVLLTLGNIYDFFDCLDESQDGNKEVKSAMTLSIERRWGKTDQELFILAVFLNPYIRAKFFNADHLSFIALFHIARRSFLRLTGNNLANDPVFLRAFTDYYHQRGDFSRESMWLDGYAEMYQKENGEESVDVLQVWQGMRGETTDHGRGAFIDLALRVLSIVPNSASTECLFSMFGTTHTKRRNRLEPQKVHRAAVVRLDQNRRFRGLKPSRKKRRFDSEVGPGTGSGAGNVGSGGGSLEAAAAAMLAEQGDLDGDGPVAPSFSSVAEGLIKAAQEVPETLDDDDDDIPERLSDLIPSQARARVAQQQPAQPAPTPNHTPSTTPTSTYKRVKLADLFVYERAQDEGCNGLKFYWHIGEAIAETEKCMLEMHNYFYSLLIHPIVRYSGVQRSNGRERWKEDRGTSRARPSR